MFARVITAQAGAEGFDDIIGLAEQQLPGARQRPGFQSFYLLADDETGKLIDLRAAPGFAGIYCDLRVLAPGFAPVVR